MKKSKSRVVGLDVHPDSFCAAILEGRDPVNARIAGNWGPLSLNALESWAKKHTTSTDTLVLEASGNAFAVAKRLHDIQRHAIVLESHMAGKIGKTYCANDRVDAVKVARIYLSGLSPVVWQPDEQTRQRRELFSAYQAVVREATRSQQHLKSMLNEHCLRLAPNTRLTAPGALERLLALRSWTPIQRLLLEQIHQSLVDARARRSVLRRQMALDLEQDEFLMRLWRLTGLSLITIYGLVSAIGDIRRFSHSRKLVAYFGLNPSTSQSGKWEGGGALKRHGRGAIRALLVQAAKRLLHVPNPLQKWGLALAMRRGRNRAAVTVARKLTVAIWHVLMGHSIGTIDSETRLHTKIHKLATILGIKTLRALGYESKLHFTQKRLYLLKSFP